MEIAVLWWCVCLCASERSVVTGPIFFKALDYEGVLHRV